MCCTWTAKKSERTIKSSNNHLNRVLYLKTCLKKETKKPRAKKGWVKWKIVLWCFWMPMEITMVDLYTNDYWGWFNWITQVRISTWVTYNTFSVETYLVKDVCIGKKWEHCKKTVIMEIAIFSPDLSFYLTQRAENSLERAKQSQGSKRCFSLSRKA